MREREFERLYENHAQSLFGFLAYRTGDRGLAEDLLGDAFERAYRSRGSFDPRRASEKTWIYAIALNLVRDHHRRRSAESRALERVGALATAPRGNWDLEGVEERDALGRALARLAPEEREAIAMRFGGDLTVPEIAWVTGEKLTTVEGRVYRALRKLRDHLAEPS